MKKNAFTLAETLITLVVIGVVAAITIPVIEIKHQKDQTVIQLKKAYSDFARAALLSQTIHGDIGSWDFSLNNHNFFDTYFYPYINLSEQSIADAKKDNIRYLQTSGQEETGLLIMRDQGTIVELMSGCQIFTYPLNYGGTGSEHARRCYAVDINGYRKPNKFGRDLFMLCVDSERGVIPHGWNDNESATVKKTRQQLLNGPSQYSYQCSKKARGMWCAAVIMNDGWQIKKDYPW